MAQGLDITAFEDALNYTEDDDAELQEYLPESVGTTAKRNVQAAANTDADRYARQLEVSRKTGVPAEAIDDPDQVERDQYLFTIDPAEFEKAAPRTAEWLSDADKAQIAHDDMATLRALENETNRSWFQVDERAFKGMGDSMMIGMGKMYDQAMLQLYGGMTELLEQSQRDITDRNWSEYVHPLQLQQDMMQEMAIKWGMSDDQVEKLKEMINESVDKHKQNLEFAESEIARLTPQGLTTAEKGARGALQMVADMGPGLLTSLVTRGRINPTLPYLTGKTYLDSYGSAIVAGKDHNTAMTYAGIDAAIEYATEVMPTKRIEAIFGEIGKGGIKTSIKRWLVGEALGEQVATAGQSLNAYMYDLDEELSRAKTWQEVARIQGERQAVTFISTLLAGGGISGTAKSLDWVVNRERRATAKLLEEGAKRVGSESEQDRLDRIFFLAQASKTNERAKQDFNDFMDKVAPEQKIYIDSEAVEGLENPPASLVKQLDGSGGTVEMSMADFLTEMTPEQLEQLRPFIKTRENLQTQTELEQDTDNEYIQTLLQRATASAEVQAESQQIFEQVRDQLIGTGRQGTPTASQSAALYPAFFTAQYEDLKRRGITNEDGSEISLTQLYEDMGLIIAGPAAPLEETGVEFMNQQEASEYDQAVAKGLDMDQVSRLTRAREMGYDIENVYYHGTMSQPFDQFDSQDFGTWFSTNPAVADKYAGMERRTDVALGGEQIMPVYLRAGNTFDLGSYDLNAEVSVAEFLAGVNQLNGTNLSAQQFGFEATDVVPVWQLVGQNDLGTTAIRESGFDTVAGTEGGDTVVAALDSTNIRSVNAAFDPDFTDSPRVLRQQNFGDTQLVDEVIDEAGNVIEIVESAQALWNQQASRRDTLEALRRCASG